MLLTTDVTHLHYTVPVVITVELLLLNKSQFTKNKNAQNILQCTQEHVLSWTVATFQGLGEVANGVTGTKNALVKRLSF